MSRLLDRHLDPKRIPHWFSDAEVRLIVFHSGLWYAFIALAVWDHSHAEAVASH